MGAHEDMFWPIDGPTRDGRMAWPPRRPGHRADFTIHNPEGRSAIRVKRTYTAESADAAIAELLGPTWDERHQPIKDVWSGNPDTDKFWRADNGGENFD